MKVALVYDRVNKWGGAERVLLTLHEMFPQASLYTSVYNPKTAPWAKVFPKIYTSWLQGVTLESWRAHHEWLAPLMPIAFEQFDFDSYDLVISVTSEAAKGIITKPKTLHICYCLTPTRYLWNSYNDYFRSPLLKTLSKSVISYLRVWDKIAAQRPDYYIAISKEVQGRIKKYYGRESIVIYPPVTFARGPVAGFPSTPVKQASSSLRSSAPPVQALPAPFDGVGSPSTHTTPRSFFLIVSRLVPYKRIDLAIDAFNELGWPLKIVGTGVEERKLRNMSKRNIEFLSNLTDSTLSRYYEDCTALVVPGIEDFGLSILEAQSYGRPVIAFRSGGALETVIEGVTGEFFNQQTKKALMKSLKDFNNKRYRRENCMENARKFNKERFKKELMTVINQSTNL